MTLVGHKERNYTRPKSKRKKGSYLHTSTKKVEQLLKLFKNINSRVYNFSLCFIIQHTGKLFYMKAVYLNEISVMSFNNICIMICFRKSTMSHFSGIIYKLKLTSHNYEMEPKCQVYSKHIK